MITEIMQKLTYRAVPLSRFYCVRLAFMVSVALILSGCSALEFSTLNPFQKVQMELAYFNAESLRKDGRYVEAAEELWDTMPSLPSPYRERMQIKASEILIEGNHILNAFRYLRQIDESVLESDELLEKRVLDAKFYVHTGQPDKVLEMLPSNLIDQGDRNSQIQALDIRATNLFALRKYIDSVNDRIKRDKLLEDKNIKYTNALSLWKALISESITNIDDRVRNDELSKELKAWLDLARLATPDQVDRGELEANYIKWKSRNAFLSLPDNLHKSLRKRWDYLDFTPRKITLLLPLTGKFAKPGKAIRAGFMEEYQNSETTGTEVHVVNTDQPNDIIEIYNQAIEENSDLIVGPLVKSKVEKLIENIEFKTPSIMLNYHSENYRPKGELFQFGLLPEDEASQIAQKMIKKGHKFTLVIAPDNEWGKRLTDSFTTEYVKQGGEIREVARYNPSFLKYASFIKSTLRLDESHRRHRLVEEALESETKFTPRIRDDITSAVIFADYEKGTLIYPLIKFYYGDELPVFTTSHIYNPNNVKLLRELDGIIYCDIPAIINHSDGVEHKRPRLFALGSDVFNISMIIRRVGLGNAGFKGMTGDIELRNDGKLFRGLNWARFKRGQPVSLGAGW